MRLWGPFWENSLDHGAEIFEHSLLSHIVTAKHAARRMLRAKRGLIVEVTESDMLGASGNLMAQCVKIGLKRLALAMAAELNGQGVATLAITPGFLRSESMLEGFGVTEEHWRDAGKEDKNFLESESPLFVGRAIAALAADPQVLRRTGQLVSSWEIGRAYDLRDYDGRRPDWGALDVDFSMLPGPLMDAIRAGTSYELEWLEAVAARTRAWSAKLSRPPGCL